MSLYDAKLDIPRAKFVLHVIFDRALLIKWRHAGSTKPFLHDGGVLPMNAAVKFGVLSVSLLDENGVSLQKVTLTERDGLAMAVPELSKLSGRKGQPVRLEFTVQNGQLFSFWIE